jgi:hypothetical protein
MEVLTNNMHFGQEKADAFMTEHFKPAWTHFDVNNDNIIEVERAPQFLRYFTGDALDIDL